MIKKITAGLALMVSAVTFSQVGINTETPHPSSDLELASPDKALLLNRVDNTGVVADPQNGMLIYDKSEECFRGYADGEWSGCFGGEQSGGGTGTINGLQCESAVFAPVSLTQGIPYNGTMTVPYTSSDGGTYSEVSFTVNGLSFVLPAGTFASGGGNLVYTVTGAPSASGSMSISLSLGGQNCNVIKIVDSNTGTDPGEVLPTSLVLWQNRIYYTASVYDNDYLPYIAPSGSASTAVVNAGGGTETVVDYQGTIPTSGINIWIPVAAVTQAGTLAAYNSALVPVDPSLLEDGATGISLQLTWGSQPITTTTKAIAATIRAVGGDAHAKKLDINAGLGSDTNALGVLMAQLKYPYNRVGNLTNLSVRIVPGIPDKMFGQADNAGSTTSHNFLYMPITGEDGQIWLNNNLGADYANMNKPAFFNPAQQAETATDFHAFGSLLQWGRKPDGHEIVTWQSAGSAIMTSETSTPSSNPSHAYFIWADWYHGNSWGSGDLTLWGTELDGNSANNPCPSGFRVPTMMQFSKVTVNNAGRLKFTNIPARDPGTASQGMESYLNGSIRRYWTSTPSGNDLDAYSQKYNNNAEGGIGDAVGMPVRCTMQP